MTTPDALRLDEQFYIVAEVERSSAPLRVMKQGDSFGVFDQYGDIGSAGTGEQGFYHQGTRFLSRLELLIGDRRPLFLSSTISEDNVIFTADLTNPDILRDGHVVVARGEIHFFRSRVLWPGGFAECVRVTNHGLQTMTVPVTVKFDADFADVFEVRGTRRAERGERLPTRPGRSTVFTYRGLDQVERRTRLEWSREPDESTDGRARFVLTLERHASVTLELHVVCDIGTEAGSPRGYSDSLVQARRQADTHAHSGCVITSANETFNTWMRRSSADLRMMLADTPYGTYPYAGIPWFSTPFGRDGLITALELLWAEPSIARGVLSFLAETQAVATSDTQDSQPGKILHEMRTGEMAALGEIPFGRYYGSADATPLFVILAHAYFRRTADHAFLERLWPHILAALEWIGGSGDPDGDGFIEYARQGETGLIQQGWKDSYDSMFHADGTLARPPIATCEIQAYVFGAWHGAAELAESRGDHDAAAEWHRRAEVLRDRFEAAFWCDDLETYALALDGDKRPCRVRSSNAGHCLFTGIASPQHARRVVQTLMSEYSFTGWGIRTIAAREARYNPMSYHNGSIWPHDNALIAAGFARYGFRSEAARVTDAMLDLSSMVDLHRLPELICGFHRREGEHPTLYPVACAPQSWAAGAVYLFLSACLGLTVDARRRQIVLSRAVLPTALTGLRITGLTVGDAIVDLLLTRQPHDVGVTVLNRTGDVEIAAIK